jgi:hypothetical protein
MNDENKDGEKNFVMEIKVCKDKKMADCLKALIGAVMQICGLK